MSAIDTYTVKKGENFHSIAKKLKVDVEELKNLNANYRGGIYVTRYTYSERNYGLDPGDVLLFPKSQQLTVEKTEQSWNSNGRPVAVVKMQSLESKPNGLAALVVNSSNPKDPRAEDILQTAKTTQDYISGAKAGLSAADMLKDNNNVLMSWMIVSNSLGPDGRIVGGLTPNITPSSALQLKVSVGPGAKGTNVITGSKVYSATSQLSNRLGTIGHVADAVELGVYVVQGDTQAAKEKVVTVGVSAGTGVTANAIAGKICPRYFVKSPGYKGAIGSGLCFIGINIAGDEAANAIGPDLAKAFPSYSEEYEKYQAEQIKIEPMRGNHPIGAD